MYTLALSESLAAIILYKAIKRNHIRMEKRIFGASQTSAKCCGALGEIVLVKNVLTSSIPPEKCLQFEKISL